MRVLSGVSKDVKLKIWRRGSGRATPDEIKELTFEIVGSDIESCRFLDLFAGTGGVGIEALSRGAERCTFVEDSARMIKVLKANLAQCELGEQAEIVQFDAFNTIVTLNNRQHVFDVVFADPPDRGDLAVRAIRLVDRYSIQKPKSLIFVCHSAKVEMPSELTTLALFRRNEIKGEMLSAYCLANRAAP
ncbi:MAG: 16S rRNA (guanine(966)-N(2))-methyltransferase RsmD [Candidatus Schekmanbacteria bacterium]|nr:16S rRNA (guanine(966)-N(2))-methyltransferase RsmD [Candidatus Schekmanbacteria bacterium]